MKPAPYLAALTVAIAATGVGAPSRGSEEIPLVKGLVVVSALHFPEGDRENVVSIEQADHEGVVYRWRAAQRSAAGPQSAEFERFVRREDLAGATRLDTVFQPGDRADYPGYTAFSISSATFELALSAGSAPFTVTQMQAGSGSPVSALLGGRLKLKGELRRVGAAPSSMPLLVNGRRVTVQALRLHGRFAASERNLEQDLWVLANPAHPLILKAVTGADVLQVVRVDAPGAEVSEGVEQALAQDCRAEVPGIYFAFGSAELEVASSAALQRVADLMARHPQWTLSIEGHTDQIGTEDANQALSQRRAEAVQARLVKSHGVDPQRLRASGYGASRPRESNASLEGRARNRRVELVRPCASMEDRR